MSLDMEDLSSRLSQLDNDIRDELRGLRSDFKEYWQQHEQHNREDMAQIFNRLNQLEVDYAAFKGKALVYLGALSGLFTLLANFLGNKIIP